MEGMQSTIYYLQQELRKAKDTVTNLQQENSMLKNGSGEEVGESEVGRPRTPPVCQNGLQEDVGGWEQRTSKVSQEAAPVEDSEPCEVRTRPGSQREWERTNHEDSSSDSGELILKLEAEDIGEDEVESNHAEADKSKKEEPGNNNVSEVDSSKPADNALRKRTYPSDDSSGDDSDNVPLIKKVRRDSEISLHYNEEEDDEAGLTNGEAAVVAGEGQ